MTSGASPNTPPPAAVVRQVCEDLESSIVRAIDRVELWEAARQPGEAHCDEHIVAGMSVSCLVAVVMHCLKLLGPQWREGGAELVKRLSEREVTQDLDWHRTMSHWSREYARALSSASQSPVDQANSDRPQSPKE